MKLQKFTFVLLVLLAILLTLVVIVPQFIGADKGVDRQQLADKGFFLFKQPRDVAAVPLSNLQGETVTLSGRHNQWQLVNFGYMFCPDICPVNLRFISDIKLAWDAAHADQPLAITHITFDPARDTVANLSQYLDHHNPDYDGLTGDLDNIRQVAKQLNVIFLYEQPDEYGNYFISHSDSIALINPQGQFVGMFKGPYNDYNLEQAVEILASVINAR